MRTAVRGLAGRLNGEFVPMGFVNATELYIYDMGTGKNGFTGEPMPSEVTGILAGGSIVRMTAVELAAEAFGDEFGAAVKQVYEVIREQQD